MPKTHNVIVTETSYHNYRYDVSQRHMSLEEITAIYQTFADTHNVDISTVKMEISINMNLACQNASYEDVFQVTFTGQRPETLEERRDRLIEEKHERIRNAERYAAHVRMLEKQEREQYEKLRAKYGDA